MALKSVTIVLIFGLLLSAVYGDGNTKCYECSRGSKAKQDRLIKLYFKDHNSPTLTRALANVDKDCGSNVKLDDKYVTTCINTVCQIVYNKHDPNLTVISSCKSGPSNGDVFDNKILTTCVDDLCNNNAEGQDNKEHNNGSVILITHFSFLSLALFLFKF